MGIVHCFPPTHHTPFFTPSALKTRLICGQQTTGCNSNKTFLEEFLQSTLYLISQDFTKRGLNIYIYIYIYFNFPFIRALTSMLLELGGGLVDMPSD